MGENSGKVGLRSPSGEEERRKCSDRNISDDLLLKEIEEVRVKRKTLEAVLQECQRALEFIGKDPAMSAASSGNESDDGTEEEEERSETGDSEAEELCDLLKLRVESPNFLEKLESMDQSVMPNKLEENSSWDVISKNDLWGESSDAGPDGDGYVIVKKEDIVDGIACFMATYLLSLKETRELTPNQLQEALRKTFSGKKRKGKLQKAWDGSKVLYNVASWGATAMGIYQNPALVKAASTAFWTSCHVISRLL